MHKKAYLFIILISILLISITSAQTQSQARQLTDQGSNFETQCTNNLCTTTIYSYDKYFNRNNQWEEIDENWISCEESFCTNNYYFRATINQNSEVTIQDSNRQLTQQLSSINNINQIQPASPTIQGNTITYENILPNTDLKYQYLPHKLKEEIIIKQRIENLQDDLQLTFNILQTNNFNLEAPFICDSNRKCKPINQTQGNNQIILTIPRKFLNNETTVYPVIIDPSFSISNSSIIWNGRVEYDFLSDSAPNYLRISNPSTLYLGATDAGAALGDIDWNLNNIPKLGTINNATLTLFIEELSANNYLNITNMEKNSSQWPDDFNGNQNFFNDMDNGTSYSSAYSPIPGSNFSYNFNFNQQGLDSINTAFTTSKRFSTGLSTNWSNNIAISARDNANATRRPRLTIQHTKEDYTLQYDGNGNMISGFGKYMEYDSWNRLSKIKSNNATGVLLAEYFYDHEGKRVRKVVYNPYGNGHNESTYYMNTRPADFIQVINTNGTIINETYIYLQDKLIAKFDNEGRKFFYHPDHLGSTSLVTNESGDVVEDLLYLPYGDLLSGDEISRFTYTGQESDSESGFMDYGARPYYAPFKKWFNPDSIIQNIFNPQNLNRYSYVLNNPYKYVDSTGNLIELVVRQVAQDPTGRYLHAYFDITPDNPSDFGGSENFQLGAGPNGGELKSRSKGEKGVSKEYSRTPLSAPQGDTVAIRELMDIAKRVDNANIDYDLFPELTASGENSNSFASTLISEGGLNLPEGTDYKGLIPDKKSAPGLGSIFDIEAYKKLADSRSYYNPIGNKIISFYQKEGNRPNRPSGGAWGWNSETGWWRVRGT